MVKKRETNWRHFSSPTHFANKAKNLHFVKNFVDKKRDFSLIGKMCLGKMSRKPLLGNIFGSNTFCQ